MSTYVVFLLILSLNWRECHDAILRGTRVREGQFPWLIQFETVTPCGGVLVSPDWILTAAQCVQHKRNSITVCATGLNGTGSRQSLGIKATYIFPHYQAYSMTRDHDHNIALLKLMQPFDMCDERVHLLDTAVEFDNYKPCLIFGWQSYVAASSTVHAKPIQYSRVFLDSWKLCMSVLKENTSHDNVFCTMIKAEDGIKACAGNPGSPVICEDQYKRMVLLGIASGSNFSLDCGGLSGYLNVSSFRFWMYDLIYNDKKTEKWDGKSKSSSEACRKKQHVEETFMDSNVQNYTNLLQSDYHLSTSYGKSNVDLEGMEKSFSAEIARKNLSKAIFTVSKMLESWARNESSIFKNHDNDYKKISLPHGILDGTSNTNTVREDHDSLVKYREIDQTKSIYNKTNDTNTVLSEYSKLNFLEKPPLDRILVQSKDQKYQDDKADDLELIMSLNYENFSESCCLQTFTHSNYFIAICTFVHLTLLIVFYT